MRFFREFIISVFIGIGFVHAQNKQILYDFMEVPQSLMVNPGMETDFKWFSGIPIISGISGYGGSNGIAVNELFAADGLDINDKVRNRMLQGLKTRDEFSWNTQITWLSGGFRSKDPNVFYSFGSYLEIDNIAYWPRDYAFLVFEGNADQLDRRFDLSDLKAGGSMVNVIHFGVNKKMKRGLTLGARGKIYAGILDYNTTRNKGYLVNTEGRNNPLSTTLDADLKLRSSGFGEIRNAENEGNVANSVLKRALFGGDLGLGLDLGFSYHLNERTVLTGSLLDLGFIYHSGDVYTYSLNGKATTEGIEINVLEDFADLNRDFWQDLVDDIEELIPFATTNKGYVTFRPTKLYGSIRHDFGKPIGNLDESCDCSPTVSSGNDRALRYRNSAGGQLYVINRPRGPQMAITAFYVRRLGNSLALKATYTADKFSYTNVGLGLNLQAGPVNFYLMADNLLSYQNIAASNYASFQLGLNIISWGRK
ncbi:DUF5723 family protein [Maribacter sp. 2304DJ31-5]|uniref:DUF5723 family protein n=1 Tax=Maribacter sp. 2304DJ31-5 TaxID=3386273 RepID=UPI0039BC8819